VHSLAFGAVCVIHVFVAICPGTFGRFLCLALRSRAAVIDDTISGHGLFADILPRLSQVLWFGCVADLMEFRVCSLLSAGFGPLLRGLSVIMDCGFLLKAVNSCGQFFESMQVEYIC